MPPKKSLRRRPATPNLNVDQLRAQVQEVQNQPLTADPNSPPETPTTSPPFLRKTSLKPRRQPDFHDYFQSLDSDPNIKPTGDGHQFSYQPSVGPHQLSPRSSSSSGMADDTSDEDSSSEDEDEEDSASPSIRSMGNATGPAVSSPIDDSAMELGDDDTDSSSDSDTSESDSGSESDRSGATDEAETSHITVTSTATATVACNFTVEDIDPMDSDCDGLDVLQPTEIESNRSRSRSRSRKAHKTMVKDFRNLTCSNETSDNEQSPEGEGEGELDEEAQFLKRREQIKKFRRMSMGSSFGKRTHSELSDSEDEGEGLDANEVGSSARRMRRKMHRTSLLFHDPPPARIEELEEPDSSEDELVAHQHLARELPYWAIEIMEMGSSSS